MNQSPIPLTERTAWRALTAHAAAQGAVHLRKLFTQDPTRGTRMVREAEGLYLDFSKHRITDETFRLLIELAEQSGLRERIDAMFRGLVGEDLR